MICLHNVLENLIFVFSLDSRTPEIKKIIVRYQKIQINHFAHYVCVESLLPCTVLPSQNQFNSFHCCQMNLSNKYHIQNRLKYPCSMTKLMRFCHKKKIMKSLTLAIHSILTLQFFLYLRLGSNI